MKILPSLKQLEYLVALDEEGHFRNAAERCHVTPSTLSAGIKDLENVLGLELAERTKRSVLMTPVGREIAARGRLLLRDAEEIMDLARSQNEPLSGSLRLGVIPTISPFLLPQVLPALREKYPDLKLFLLEEKTEYLLEQLRGGELDAALIAFPYPTTEFTALPLFADCFYLSCNRHHPLATKNEIALADLHDVPLMLLSEGHCLRTHALEACKLAERKQGEEFEATSLHTLVHMVDAGLGVTLLPEMAVKCGMTEGTQIKNIPLCQAQSREIGLVWRKTSAREKEFRLLGDALTVKPASTD